MKKPHIVAGGIVFISLAVYSAIIITRPSEYASANKEKLELAILEDSAYAEQLAKMETSQRSISYEELSSVCNKAVEQNTALMSTFQGLSPSISHELKVRLIAYLDAANQVTRKKKELYLAEQEVFRFNFNNHSERQKGMVTYYVTVNIAKVEALQKYDQAASSFQNSYEKVVEAERELEQQTKRSGIHFTPIFRNYQASNIQYVESVHQLATRYGMTAKTSTNF
jgi:hypothetical protein